MGFHQKYKHIDGEIASGFELVRERFIQNFHEFSEIGAACTIYYQGDKVVDLWGGYSNPVTKSKWQEDTLIQVFSGTNGFAALAVALANSRGLLDYDEKVATYWPAFAIHQKETITIRQLLAHQAGLCTLDGLDIHRP